MEVAWPSKRSANWIDHGGDKKWGGPYPLGGRGAALPPTGFLHVANRVSDSDQQKGSLWGRGRVTSGCGPGMIRHLQLP
jgi:hypothetical protein